MADPTSPRSPKQSAWIDELKARTYQDALRWAADIFRRYPYEEAQRRITEKYTAKQLIVNEAEGVRRG